MILALELFFTQNKKKLYDFSSDFKLLRLIHTISNDIHSYTLLIYYFRYWSGKTNWEEKIILSYHITCVLQMFWWFAVRKDTWSRSTWHDTTHYDNDDDNNGKYYTSGLFWQVYQSICDETICHLAKQDIFSSRPHFTFISALN